jgi:hypothetical protein
MNIKGDATMSGEGNQHRCDMGEKQRPHITESRSDKRLIQSKEREACDGIEGTDHYEEHALVNIAGDAAVEPPEEHTRITKFSCRHRSPLASVRSSQHMMPLHTRCVLRIENFAQVERFDVRCPRILGESA